MFFKLLVKQKKLWLFVLFWHDKFIIELMKYVNYMTFTKTKLIRTQRKETASTNTIQTHKLYILQRLHFLFFNNMSNYYYI